MRATEAAAGISLLCKLRGHTQRIVRVVWSPDGQLLASASDDYSIRIWSINQGQLVQVLHAHTAEVGSIAWSPDQKLLASGSADRTIRLWSTETWQPVATLTAHIDRVRSVAWSPDGSTLASGANDFTVRLWNRSGAPLAALLVHRDRVTDVAWSPDGLRLASAGDDGTILLLDPASGNVIRALDGHRHHVFNVLWMRNNQQLLSCSYDSTIRIWNTETGATTQILEEHRDAIGGISFSAGERLLASKSIDNTVRLWDTRSWTRVAIIREPRFPEIYLWHSNLAFHPAHNMLATLGEQDTIVRIWQIRTDELLESRTRDERIRLSDPAQDVDVQIDGLTKAPVILRASAKVVVLGESDVGKTCLTRRIISDSFPQDQEPTHAMNVWSAAAEKISLAAAPQPGVMRDVVFWDMGGHSEYRLVHQLFLPDTIIALLLINPRRGNALADAEDWVKRLDKALAGRTLIKFLVGTKADIPGPLIDEKGLDAFVKRNGFASFLDTSALNGAGIDTLKESIAAAIDWDNLTRTSRPELFEYMRKTVDDGRRAGNIILPVAELARKVRIHTNGEAELDAVDGVIRQLALQGLLAEARLGGRERVLILDVGEIERYAGSLILAARANPRGVPALEEGIVASAQIPFPTLHNRLDAIREQTVLQCVIQMLLENQLCLRHIGMLIFPDLFRTEATPQQRSASSYSVSLSYDFSGGIDNIYSSLIVGLHHTSRFGQMRLWQDVVEFEPTTGGICGLHKTVTTSGVAHLDIYFDEKASKETRDVFVGFVEQHLRERGLNVTPSLGMICQCGKSFDETIVQEFLREGRRDIICQWCRRVNLITGSPVDGADAPAHDKMIALRRIVEQLQADVRKENAQEAKMSSTGAHRKRNGAGGTNEPIRILHLSDLHMGENSDPEVMAQKLISDLRDPSWMNLKRLDHIVVSGDFADRATPVEFGNAKEFLSRVLTAFQVPVNRAVFVPGNHDVDWEAKVYDWQPRAKVNPDRLAAGSYFEDGSKVVMVRDDTRYPERFLNYSRHFYHPLVQEEYPLKAKDQFQTVYFEDTQIQFLAMNSCTDIDQFFPDRASIRPDLLARCLTQAEEKVASYKLALRIAVMHHPVTGNEKIWDTAFLQELRRYGVRLCLHGHVHEVRTDIVSYLETHPVHVFGGGAFGTRANQRPDSMPRLYNLLEISRPANVLTVHTRKQMTPESAWEAYAVYPMSSFGSDVKSGRLSISLSEPNHPPSSGRFS